VQRDSIEPVIEVLALADRFVEDLAGDERRSLSPAARAKLQGHDWPGNVRQLRNVIQRAVVLAHGPTIDADDIEIEKRDSRPTMPFMKSDEAPEELRARAEEAERKRILDALDECAGNQTRAAQLLGITRRVLVRKLEKFNLPRPRRDRVSAEEIDDE
jgi:two-component system, NtrC family, response regulator AtoC